MKPKTYKDRDHTVSKNAKDLRRAIDSQKHGKPTNIGDPTDKGKKG